MELSKKHRKVLRGVFTKAAKELDQLLTAPGESTDNLHKVQVCFELLMNKHIALKRADGEIYDALLAADFSEEDLSTELEGCEIYDRKFTDLKLRCENMVVVSRPVAEDMQSVVSRVSGAASTHHGITGRRKFKLPTIEFKKFDGNIRDWLSFWAQFRKVHEDPDIDQADKIEYLIQVTVPNSRARQLVESFPAVGENYDKIISALQSRFGRDDLQIEVYVRELLKLIISNATSQNKMDLSMLYDRLETQLRALETLGVTSEKCSAMLFPLIESCLPEDLLRVWQRVGHREDATELSPNDAKATKSEEKSIEGHLRNLMSFLKNEVVNEQRIALATEGFGLRSDSAVSGKDHAKGRKLKQTEHLPTATGLINCESASCIFCEGSHNGDGCFKAQNFSLERKRDILFNRKACFRCLKIGHQSKKCRGRLRCLVCNKSHVTLMCPELPAHKESSGVSTVRKTGSKDTKDTVAAEQALANNTSCHVFLNTLRVTLHGVRGSREIRVLIDTGSQKSYILQSTAQELGFTSKRKEKIIHSLFGGTEQEQRHDCFDVSLSYGDYSCMFEVLDQPLICKDIPPVFYGPWLEELKELDVKLEDTRGAGAIELLIGADICGNLYTGKRHILRCGLVAVETLLGWTLSGRIPLDRATTSATLSVFSLLVKDSCIADLWKLDVLGITEPSEKRSRDELALAVKDIFEQTVRINEENRYEVRLPFLEGHPRLPSNYGVSKKRLDSTVKKLKGDRLFDSYDLILKEWLDEGIIEEVPEEQMDSTSHYLPHRPVLKESSTTKIRPVFDASAREKGQPSLNNCLEKGVNLIELIPSILQRFRVNRIGVVSDIRKAFLQISIQEADRDYLRFLWLDSNGRVKTYRHRRVVFGLNSSPFLLGATIEHHLSEKLKECEVANSPYSKDTILRLSRSFYVDNCVTSVSDYSTLEEFIRESSMLMAEVNFDLRGWEFTQLGRIDTTVTPVLGLSWCITKDTLAINGANLKELTDIRSKVVTKRLILSIAQRVFDPIGFTCPAILSPKLLLQRTWKQQLGWDTPVDTATEQTFREWIDELPHLLSIEIPRWTCAGIAEGKLRSLHTFCDASKDAYAAVVFLRIERDNEVAIYLLAAKSRIAPLKEMTIPRLELLSATIGARLWKSVRENLDNEVESFFWSDSSTVISWIWRKEDWAPFVGNRVTEIRSLTPIECWRHVPGRLNPADLPSRGCSPKHLLESRWWEGPKWLHEPQSRWIQENAECDEEEINKERKKMLVASLLNDSSNEWHLTYSSKYIKIVRMTAWIFRFIYNARHPMQRRQGQLTAEEIDMAEVFVFKTIQQETFPDENDKRICTLNPFRDQFGVIRLKSRVSNRKDDEHFRFPVVLPAKHPVVNSLILEVHEKSCHVGTQGLLSILREKYWILGGRRTLRSVISRCIVCKRQSGKSFVVDSPPLPRDRVRDAVPFEVTGVDFAGPLYLNTGKKVWVCLFTCAVYRAVHLEMTTSLSTVAFMKVLRRFVARRGRPKTIYSDRGTNFIGTENAFSRLDWTKIVEETSVQRIMWRFNPPTAPWWGGFWERLIGVLKGLLRKVLGRASLNYEDLLTLICECEAIINARPLTYISDDPNDLIALTPAMFLRDQAESRLPDCDAVDQATPRKKIPYIQRLRDNLRCRFRSEYLGQLKLLCRRKRSRPVSLGEVVLIGNDRDKRLEWPLGRVDEMLPGKDGVIRLVHVSTTRGRLLRPIQRLYPLEEHINSNGDEKSDSDEETGAPPVCDSDSAGVSNVDSDIESRVPVSKVTVTRSGRISKLPNKFIDFVL